MPESEAILFDRFISSGDNDAFAGLVRQYSRMVLNVSMRILQDEKLAEDITQETFFEFLKKPP